MVLEFRLDSPRPLSESPDRLRVPSNTRAARPGQAPVAERSFGPDAPVRVEVEMPRDLYDRLTGHDDAPRCRYDMATRRAEFVAEPGAGHERRASTISGLFSRIDDALADAGHPYDLLVAAATRLLSDDGAFEPDASLFLDPVKARRAAELEDYLDVRKGHPVPDLVVEIDRSASASHKLVPYFRMGVREVWTWSHRGGVRLWVADAASDRRFREASRSRVLPGLQRDALDGLLAVHYPSETSRRARMLARQVARAMLRHRPAGDVRADAADLHPDGSHRR